MTMASTVRHSSGFPGFDRVAGGGLARGSLSIFLGEPEVSTLLLEVARRAAAHGADVLYVAGARDGAWQHRVLSARADAGQGGTFHATLGASWEYALAASARANFDLVVIDALDQVAMRDNAPPDPAALTRALAGRAHPAEGAGSVVLARSVDPDPFEIAWDFDARFTLARALDDVLWLAANKNRHGPADLETAFRLVGDRLVERDVAALAPWSAKAVGA